MEKVDGSLKTVVLGAGIFFIGMLFSKFFNYFFRLITARLGTESYGIVALSLSFVSVLSVVATLGLNNGVLRYVPFFHSKNEDRKVKGVILFSLKVSLIVGLFLGLILFVFSDLISAVLFPHFNQQLLSTALKIVSFALPLTAILFIFYASFEAFRALKYEIYAKNIFDGAFKVVLTFLAVYFGFSIFGVMFVYVAAILGAVVLSFYYLNRFVFPLFKRERPDYVSRELFYYSLPLVLSGLCIILIASIDSWIIGFFRNASEVGIYNAALPTAQLLYTVPSIILILFLPVLSELYAKNDTHSFASVYKSVTKWIFFVNLPLAVLFLLFSKDILGILFGSDYISGAIPFMFLSVGFLANSLFMTSERMLMVVKRTRFILFSYIVVLVVNALLNLYLVPKYGIAGAGVASGSSYALLGLFFMLGSYRFTGTLPFTLSYLKAVFAILIALGIAIFVKGFFVLEGGYFRIAVMGLFGLSYLALLFVFRSFDKEDIMIINSVKNKVGGYLRIR